jgi:hypothetical protein
MTQEDRVFLRLSRKEVKEKEKTFKIIERVSEKIAFFVSVSVTLSERMSLSALEMTALNP